MRRRLFALAFLTLSLVTVSATRGRDQWPPKRVLPADELTPAHREQLQRDKLIIGAKDYPQIFSPYLQLGREPESIRFITSDAALAAYHALFEDSFRELELHRAVRLQSDLKKLYESCRHKEGKNSDVPELIQHILGPALVIFGLPASEENFASNLIPEIKRQASLITEAQAQECPPWLDYCDTPHFQIDYRRCKPVSFYSGNPTLENHHRVVRWLQMVPLRATNDAELSAWATLTDTASPRSAPPDFQRSFTGLASFVGPVDEPGIITNNPAIHDAFYERHWDARKMFAPLRAALLAQAPQGTRLEEIRFHVMPTHTLPDAEILLECLKKQIRPNGLMVAAHLGSSFARERMPAVDSSKWDEWNARARFLTHYSQDGQPRSLYCDYMELLRTLNAPRVKEAPAFMDGLPRQAKTCQTQLASWAQMRHTFALQGKVAVYAESAEPKGTPPGFIEPNPAFWREYIRLIERAIALLEKESIFESSTAVAADEYRRQATKLESLGLHRPESTLETLENLMHSPDFDIMVLHGQAFRLLARANNIAPLEWNYTSASRMRDDYKQVINSLRVAADKIENGELHVNSYKNHSTLKDRWETLAILARQLEAILAKQLADTDLTDAERAIIISTGDALAESMGYFGDAKGMPRDDAPRWAEVAHATRADQSLAAATGRARALFVLYPWRGRELLCTGAVLGYYEEWAATKRLTDDEWKHKLDSPAAPQPPDWLAPILAK